ncbi:MAG: ribosome small subunit-dependent GTPase A [Phycisphaerae bacterium]|nr:ribosome small subunit-dependent GTPase A [Phycisphaerae bacterium]
MAKGGHKGKGKSRRRVKDWQVRYEAGEDVEADLARRQGFSPREVKLGPGALSETADDANDESQRDGMVTGVFRRGVFVRVEGEELFCGLAKTFRPPDGFEHTSPLTVGDEVRVALPRNEHVGGQVHLDRNRMDGMILSRRPRRSLLARPQPRSAKRRDAYDTECFTKALVANMDDLLIVTAVAAPPMRRGLIDRFLIIARRGELEPMLVVNKIDLGEGDEPILADVADQGVRILRCSARTGEGIDELRSALAHRHCVLAGASGVGKTSLLNALVPGTKAATREVRAKDDRGRHTTSQARVYDLHDGGMIVDTPGLRELGVGITAAELPWYFPEIEAVAPRCKFRDCTHTHEPGCAVRDAVETEQIPPRRYESYLRILESLG